MYVLTVIWRINRMFVLISLLKIAYDRGRKREIELTVPRPLGTVTLGHWGVVSDPLTLAFLAREIRAIFVIHGLLNGDQVQS